MDKQQIAVLAKIYIEQKHWNDATKYDDYIEDQRAEKVVLLFELANESEIQVEADLVGWKKGQQRAMGT